MVYQVRKSEQDLVGSNFERRLRIPTSLTSMKLVWYDFGDSRPGIIPSSTVNTEVKPSTNFSDIP